MVFSPGSMKPYQRKVQSCKKANGDVGEQGGNRCEDLKERDVDLTNRFLEEIHGDGARDDSGCSSHSLGLWEGQSR